MFVLECTISVLWQAFVLCAFLRIVWNVGGGKHVVDVDTWWPYVTLKCVKMLLSWCGWFAFVNLKMSDWCFVEFIAMRYNTHDAPLMFHLWPHLCDTITFIIEIGRLADKDFDFVKSLLMQTIKTWADEVGEVASGNNFELFCIRDMSANPFCCLLSVEYTNTQGDALTLNGVSS